MARERRGSPDRGLDVYREKRDFARTPEPQPGAAADCDWSGGAPFVVHRHAARGLHFDLRLGVDGALASWAVPKGFSYDPSQKRLAIRTENHPLEYLSFEGVIPVGQYGAGAMAIWDRGTVHWRPGYGPGDVDGELKFVLDGGRLRGEWHLVRTAGDGRQWLVFKARDEYSGPDRDTLAGIDLNDAPRRALPARLRKMRAVEQGELFSDPEWMFEAEFDGRRSLAILDRDAEPAARLVGVAEAGAWVRALETLRARRAVLDGVLVEGVYYAFDVLAVDGFDLRTLPLRARKVVLRRVIPGGDEGGLAQLQVVDPVMGDGPTLASVAAGRGVQALIAKRADSTYRGGSQQEWRRIPLVADAGAHGEGGRRGASGPQRFTNLGKLLWPDDGITKGDLIAYYRRVAPTLTPYLIDRPLHLHRFPDGIHGESFYQRHGEGLDVAGVSSLEVTRIDEGADGVARLLCITDERGPVSLANLGSIDLHPWMCRRSGSRDWWNYPDLAVWDLDPKGAPFASVVRLAQECGDLLRRVGLEPLVKTSGREGLHVCVGLVPRWTFEQVGMFCEGVARILAFRHPELATVERAVHRRGGRIYVDVQQNRRGQSVVAPYAVRPCPGATVSTPVSWRELGEAGFDPRQFDLHTVPDRVRTVGDLFASVREGQDLMPAIEGLAAELGR